MAMSFCIVYHTIDRKSSSRIVYHTMNRTSLLHTLALLSLFIYAPLANANDNDTLISQTIADVTITEMRTSTGIQSTTVSTIDRGTLTESHQPNILNTLSEQVPGLFVTQRGMYGFGVSNGAAGGISLRGVSSTSGQLLVLVDGCPQYSGIYGHSIADACMTSMAESVEIVRGPLSAIYGSNAMGGVVNIVTRKMPSDGIRTEVSLGAGSWGTLQADASNLTRNGRFSSAVTAQYVRTDNHRRDMGFEQYGGTAKLACDISHHWNASADLTLTHFNASYPGTTDAPMLEADQWITRGMASVSLINNYGQTSGRLNVFHSFGRNKVNDGHAVDAAPQTRYFRSRDAITGFALCQSQILWNGRTHITEGFDWQHIYGRAWYTSRSTGETLDTPNKQSGRAHMNEVAGYILMSQRFTNWLTADAGLRLDHHSVAGSEWIPQLGIVAKPAENITLKLTAGKGFRNPTMREMYLYPPSNEDLMPERLWNYELSFQHSIIADRLTYGLNLYIIRGDNIITTINKHNVNTGEISNRGIEVNAAWKVNSHISLTTNHSFLHMDHHIAGAPEYQGYLGARTGLGRLTLNIGLQQINRLFTAVTTSSGVNNSNPSASNSDSTEDFTLVNASVAYRLSPKASLWVRGDNLLCQKYQINLGHPMPLATFMAGISLTL